MAPPRLQQLVLLVAAVLWPGSLHSSGSVPPPRPASGVSVLSFGAARDGTTDDTAAFEAALGTASDVFVPNGTYVIRRTLLLRNGQTLRGAGSQLASLKFIPSATLAPSAACVKAVPTAHGGAGITLEGLGVAFENNAGVNLNRGVDLTAASFATVTDITVVGFHTGLYLSRGAGAGAGSCFFNTVEKAKFFSCKLAVDLNDDVGYSVNNCNFRDLHASDVGVWLNGTGYRVTGYGHRFSDIYAGGLEGTAAVCVEFGAPKATGVSISGDNLVESVYCENGGAAYGIKVATGGTGGRGGNHIIGLHMDAQPLISTVYDPWGEITLQAAGWTLPPGPKGEAQSAGGVPGWRLSQVEMYSILGSPSNPAGGLSGPPHHMSFWRPEGEQAGHAAGSITSNLNGTATQFNTAADRRLLIPESIGTLTGALDTVIAGPSAKEFSFHAAPGQVQSGFIADELRKHAPDAVSKSALEEVDNSKLVPLLWNALKELAAETAELKGRLAAAGL